jgi:gliding motility-associated-like protein
MSNGLKTIIFFFFVVNICRGQKNISEVNNLHRGKPLASCNNWLNLSSYPSYVNVGDLDVSGDQITVEAQINRTAPYSGGYLFAGDVVSKHKDPININYLLRPSDAEITTADGVYHITPAVCDIELNKTYHIALVYDGAMLKFYRNGILLSQTPVTGNLYQNDFATRIGEYEAQLYNENFIGYINEVRIWNVARTQSQIQTYMNTSLPSPSTQTGLLAYFTFDDLLNKQGNATWNGTLSGSASINQVNPQCPFLLDNDCCPALSGTLTGNSICIGEPAMLTFHSTSSSKAPYTIVYTYAGTNYTASNVSDGVPFPVEGLTLNGNLDYNLVSIQDASGCAPTPVTGAIATITVNDCMPCTNWLGLPGQPSYADVGDVSVSGNQLTVEALINRTADFTSGTPEEGDVVSRNNDLTDANYLLRPNHAYISTTMGFYATPDICDISLHKTYHVAMVYDGATLKFYRNGYLMSQVAATGNLIQNSARTTIGYNSSQTNNENFIGYINEVKIWSTARTQAQIRANMNAPLPSPATQTGLMAYYTFNSLLNQQGDPSRNAVLGGRAQSSAININCTFVADNLCCRVIDGGLEGNAICAGETGMLVFKPSGLAISPFDITYTDGFNTFVQKGVQPDVFFPVPSYITATTTYEITKIFDGDNCLDEHNNAFASVVVHQPVDFTLTPDSTVCKNSNVRLSVSGGSGFLWSPAIYLDNPNSPDPVATPVQDTEFYVTGKDADNCDVKDSVFIKIQPKPVFNAPSDQTVCKGDSVVLKGNNDPSDIYSWSPASTLNDAGSPAPQASPDITTTYHLHIVNAHCSLYDSAFDVQVLVNPSPVITAQKSNDINCSIISSNLSVSGSDSYTWTPASGLNDPNISSPVATISQTTTFIVQGKNAQGCISFDSVTVAVTKTGENTFSVPNAFTPNGDHINDCFGIHSWGQVNIQEFSVYNRWGQKVFYTRDPSACWDGSFQGEKLESGTFVYIIRASSFCGDVSRKGTVLLIR